MHEYEEKHSHTNTLPNNFYNLSSDNYSSKYNLDWKKFEKKWANDAAFRFFGKV